MKKSLVLTAFAVTSLISCVGVSSTTTISGNVAPEIATEVKISSPDQGIDTLITVVDGSFEYEMPTNLIAMATIAIGEQGAEFIPDGTKLSVEVGEGLTINSNSKNSATANYNMISVEFNNLNTSFRDDYTKLLENKELAEEVIEAKVDSLSDHYSALLKDKAVETLKNNTDNFVSIIALDILNNFGEKTDKMAEYLGMLSEEVLSTEQVKSLKSALEAELATAEGKMFLDFTVADSNGKEDKLSNYVGKGKYVLVDFWASWCGPCKAEIPNLKNIYDKYKGDNFDVLSVAVWDKPEASLASIKEFGMTWSQIINADKEPATLYGIKGIPHIILFGPDGTILKRDLRGAAIEEEILKHIK